MSEPVKNIWSVTDLNRFASKLIENEPMLHDITVCGEISGFKRHTSGHLYFTLKDEQSAIKCVMFKGQTYSLKFRPTDGDRVSVSGYVSIYQRDGSFQLYAASMEKDGIGDLFARFMELKAEYQQKGYFDPEYKKAIPYLPKAIGVVTSGSGAALQDIRQIIGRRFPSMPIFLCPVKVQGEGAALEIAKGIETLDKAGVCDVMIVGRGGGSVEDLWAFNEVPVIEAIYACRTPVISAVGHETDFSVSDFVADLRAPTPSAAAELSVPALGEVLQGLDDHYERLNRAVSAVITSKRNRLELLKSRTSVAAIRNRVLKQRNAMQEKNDRMARCVRERYHICRSVTEKLYSALTALDPERVLERGYAIALDASNTVVSDVHSMKKDDLMTVRFASGAVETRVIQIDPEEK